MKKALMILLTCLLLVTPVFASEAGQAGQRHVVATECYIDAAGQVRSWTGEVIELPGRAVDLATGVYAGAANSVLNTAVVMEDGRLYVWGYNRDGCLIPGGPEKIDTPTQIPGIENALSVSLGDGYGYIVLTSDGTVYVQEMGKPGPERVELPAAAAAVCRGGGCGAITTDGSLYVWGADGDHDVPTRMDLPPVRAVSRGVSMTAAVTEDGTLYTWGYDWGSNGYNQLGRGEPGSADFVPGVVEIGSVETAAVGRFFYAAAVDASGALWQWGSTARAYSEDLTRATDSKVPAVLAEGLPFQQLVLGSGQSAGVTAEGQLYTWGWNSRQELGSGADYYVAYPALAAEDAAFCSGVPFTGSKDKLQVRREYDGRFLDVSADAWYAQEVADAYALGLIDGMSDESFAPGGWLRLSEAVAMAVKAYERYTGNDETIENGSPWYAPYVHRAIAYGIVGVGEFADYTAYATRAEMAAIFSRVLPKAELAAVSDKSAPDVSPTDRYAAEIDLLYKAGVLKGNDDAGTFAPERQIKRAEAAAICLRLMT